MRKIVITGVAAALALGLTACDGKVTGNVTGNAGGDSSPAPASSSSSSSSPAGTAPSETSTPRSAPTPDAPSTPGGASTPQGSGGTDAPVAQPTRQALSGGQIKQKWGKVAYLSPGRFVVGDVALSTSPDTILIPADSTCPDGSPAPDDSKCSIDGFDQWATAGWHHANVRYSGSVAIVITETQ